MSNAHLAPLLQEVLSLLDKRSAATFSAEESRMLAEIGKRLIPATSPTDIRRTRSAQVYFDYALAGIIETDAAGSITDVNPAASSICCRDRKKLLGTAFGTLFSTQSTSALQRHLGLLAEQGISHAELSLETADGLREITISSIEADQNLILHVIDDVTDDRQMARELIAASKAAEAANVAKGRFLANVSHEIRTPMNGIIGLTQLALMTPLDPQQRDYLDKIAQSGKTLLGMLNDLLDFSKIEAGKLDLELADFDLYAILEELSAITSHSLAGKQLEIFFDIADGVPRYLHGDRLRLTQILINLLGNAVKFTESGRIELRIETFPAVDGEKIRFSVADTGPGIADEAKQRLFQPFSQADAGTTRRYGGTGLGLAISRQLAECMSGALTLDSEPGQGATFTLTLPLVTANGRLPTLPPIGSLAIEHVSSTARPAITNLIRAAGGHPVAESEAADLQLHVCKPGDIPTARIERAIAERTPLLVLTDTQASSALQARYANCPGIALLAAPLTPLALRAVCDRLLAPASVGVSTSADLAVPTEFRGALVAVAEDIQINQQVICGLLARAGIEVCLAENGQQLLDKLAALPRQPELILMDVHMPVMDGFAATRALRAQGFRTPIVALSAGTGRDEQTRCSEAGMSDFLAKPIDLDELWGLLTCWLPPRDSAPLAATGVAASASDEAAPDWLSTAGIDPHQLIDRFLDDMPAMQRGIAAFCTQHAAAAASLRQSIQARDFARFNSTAHALKGSAATLAANTLANLARAAENLDETQWLAGAPCLVEQIDAAVQRILAGWQSARGEAKPFRH